MPSTDIYQADDNRILIRTTTGSVQAWEPNGSSEISASFSTLPQDGGEGHAQYSQFMTIADARSLANALLKAAEHAEELLTRKAA